MRRVVSFFVRFPVWVTVLMLAVFAFGFISLDQMRYSFFPEIPPDTITIEVVYPGASPEEVAEGVVLKIEENLDGLQGVDRITSVSRENTGTVTVETLKGSDIDQVLADVKNAVDRISSFPEGAEEPVIFEQEFRLFAMSVVLFGQTDLYNLKYIAEDFRDRLLATEAISQVTIQGLPELEVAVKVSEGALQRYGLTFDEISRAVAQANINLSGGTVETEAEELLIRAWGRDYFAQQFADIPVRGSDEGTVVYLSDIARIDEQWEDVPDRLYYNGRTAVLLQIDQAENEDIIAIADTAHMVVDEFNQANANVQAVVTDDQTVPLRQRVNLLVKNGLIGLLLVIITLGFFLNLRMSWWVLAPLHHTYSTTKVVDMTRAEGVKSFLH
jgi:multidrug efflux pump subunit AcrB